MSNAPGDSILAVIFFVGMMTLLFSFMSYQMFLQHTHDVHIDCYFVFVFFPIFQEEVYDFAIGNVSFLSYFGLLCPMRQAYWS